MLVQDQQSNFNQIKGIVSEIIIDDKFCSITLIVGHKNKRCVNFSIKAIYFPDVVKNIAINDKINLHFYLASNQKHNRWYTTANILKVEKII